MPLTDAEKAENRFQRELERSKQWSVQKYLNKQVAPKFQEMIRAEAGASDEPYSVCVRMGQVIRVPRSIGMVVCVTCSSVYPWRGSNKLDAGHFLAGRYAGIVLEETNCHPQCVRCNTDGKDDTAYEAWMRHVYGQEEIDRLRALKNGPAKQWDREELVRLRLSYMDRIRAAKKVMEGGSDGIHRRETLPRRRWNHLL